MDPISFSKMHGLGNDFLVLDMITQHVELTGDLVRLWADRREGVGFDQLLVVHPPTDPETDFRFQIFNTDGTEAEQCGNGLRCFAKFVLDRGLTVKKKLVIDTLGGRTTTEVLDEGTDATPCVVQVDMGAPKTAPADIPFLADTPALSYPLEIDDEVVEVTPVSMGNPHAVVFVDNISETPVERLAAALQTHDRFPEGVNVGFLQVIDRAFGRLRVIERGVGETRACGTGACAAVTAGHLHGQFSDRVKISLPGGKVRVAWQGEGSTVKMTGPAVLVYEGHLQV